MLKSKSRVEFGDFQTPLNLSKIIVSNIIKNNQYGSIIEPTCGKGSFVKACILNGTSPNIIQGWEINPEYVSIANQSIAKILQNSSDIVKEQDFFTIDWEKFKVENKQSILFIGNPPWVTNSELGKLLSNNLPKKTNFTKLSGMDAMTGKSNFDISEWMLIKLLNFISGTNSSIAFLIKTSVARKLFHYIAKNNLLISNIYIKELDAKKYFNVSVDACLFYAEGSNSDSDSYVCSLFDSIESNKVSTKMGVVKDKLVANLDIYTKLSHIDKGSEFKWRSGIKHDASKIMELTIYNNHFRNGLLEIVNIPYDYLYPMYKSSNISKSSIKPPTQYMLVTQTKVGENTETIKDNSPETWKYLIQHAHKLDNRKSSIYKTSPRFSIFGVGEYTFLPWKIVISGLYKNLIFSKIDSYNGKSIVLDDTCYLLGFKYENEADFILKLLTSEVCKNFIESIIFLDNKRPITVALLNRINFKEISKELRLEKEYEEIFVNSIP